MTRLLSHFILIQFLLALSYSQEFLPKTQVRYVPTTTGLRPYGGTYTYIASGSKSIAIVAQLEKLYVGEEYIQLTFIPGFVEDPPIYEKQWSFVYDLLDAEGFYQYVIVNGEVVQQGPDGKITSLNGIDFEHTAYTNLEEYLTEKAYIATQSAHKDLEAYADDYEKRYKEISRLYSEESLDFEDKAKGMNLRSRDN